MREVRILAVGHTGQLARALAVDPHVATYGRDQLDLDWSVVQMHETLYQIIETEGFFDGIINAAAYTQVDKAEDDVDAARAVNGTSVWVTAEVCAAAHLPLMNISTDYVFDGMASTPYAPDQSPLPINAYGRSKRDGEWSLDLSSLADFAVLRTSWVYDGNGENFMTTMLLLAETRDTLQVVGDRRDRPTYAADLADAVLAALQGLRNGKCPGIYHVTNTGPIVSWVDSPRVIFDKAGADIDVTDRPSSEYPAPTARPAYSAPENRSFETTFDHVLPDWMNGLTRDTQSRITFQSCNEITTNEAPS